MEKKQEEIKKQENIKGTEYTMTGERANILSFIFFIPAMLITFVPYFLIWGTSHMEVAKKGMEALMDSAFSILILFSAGIIVHELIHGLCWALFAKRGFKSIAFGVMWKYLMPYCHCKDALTARQYRIGGIMPTVLLGFLPVIYAFFSGSFFWLFYGYMMIISGGGDFLILWMMRKLKPDVKVKDHPEKVGFYVPEEI